MAGFKKPRFPLEALKRLAKARPIISKKVYTRKKKHKNKEI